MNLSFLQKSDKEYFQKLFVISGCSDLLDSKDSSKILTGLSKSEFYESCQYLNITELALTTKNRSEEDLIECLHDASRNSNSQGISYFLEKKPALFNIPKKETGNLPIHTYLK